MFEAEATARRASLPTVPETQAREQASSGAGAFLLDQPKLTWAVDLGNEMRALSTFDLWYALSTGDIAGDARVWRVGREAWTPALEVPELACALADIDELVPARHTLDYIAQPPSFGAETLTREVSHIEASSADQRRSAAGANEPAIEVIAERESHDEVFEHELEEAIDTPDSELTPSADLPMGQVISLHPASEAVATPARRQRAIAAGVAVAATLAVGLSFLVAFAAPRVGAQGVSNAAVRSTDPQAPARTVAPLFDMQAEAALAEASSQRISERLSEQLAAAPREVVRRVKSVRNGAERKTWSPSQKGQQRKRATGSVPLKKPAKQPAGKAPQKRR